jgi:hypothetical protein
MGKIVFNLQIQVLGKKMRRILVFLFSALFLFTSGTVQGQAPIEIERLQVDIWPEYDRPDVLVIYRVTLSSTTALPAALTLRIPADAGSPYNLAFKDTDGMLYNLEYTTSQENDWLLVSMQAPTTDLQLEYYDPGITRDGNLRQYDYTWAGDYLVRSLAVEVQQPINATNMQIVPDMGAGQILQDGLTYYNKLFAEIDQGTSFNLHIEYSKPDDVLSGNLQSVAPAEVAPQQTTRSTSFQSVLPWILGGLGLIMVAGVAIWYMLPQRRMASVSRRRHTLSPTSTASGKKEPGTALFCHHCGQRAQPGDIFCRSCGTKLRKQ